MDFKIYPKSHYLKANSKSHYLKANSKMSSLNISFVLYGIYVGMSFKSIWIRTITWDNVYTVCTESHLINIQFTFNWS